MVAVFRQVACGLRFRDARDGARFRRLASSRRRRPSARARLGPDPAPGARVRRLPDRPPRRRRRARASEAAARPRPPDRRRGESTAAASASRGSGGLAASAATARAAARTSATARASPAYDLDGGYAEYAVADERFCFALPDGLDDLDAAPLLCAGLIGYRSLRLCGDAERLGLYGFGAAAHILAQVARARRPARLRVHARRRRRGAGVRARARREWAGARTRRPEELDAAIIFAPVGALVPRALARGRDRAASSSAPGST